jgi:hypothetical protein
MVEMVRGPKGQGNKSLPHCVKTVCASLCTVRGTVAPLSQLASDGHNDVAIM